MQVERLQILKPLERGLDPRPSTRINDDVLLTMRGLRLTPWQEQYLPVTDPFSRTPVLWDQQLFARLQERGILVYGTTLSEVNLSTWGLTTQGVYDWGTGLATTMVQGDFRGIADFGPFVVIFAAGGMAVRYDAGSGYSWFAMRDAFARTGCNLWGRMMWANVADPNNTLRTGWATLLDLTDLPSDVPDTSVLFDEHTIAWDRPEGGGFLQWFDPALAVAGFLGGGQNYLQQWRRNASGWMQAPWPVYRLMPHVRGCVVYGEGGVGLMTAVGSPYPTMSFSELPGAGVLNPRAVAGDESTHFYVDTDHVLWRVNSEMQVEQVGYQQHLADLDDTYTRLLWDPVHRELRINDAGGDGYLLTEHGMSNLPEIVVTMDTVEAQPVGCLSGTLTAGVDVETNWYDLGVRALKTLTGIHVGAFDDALVDITFITAVGGDTVSLTNLPVDSAGFVALNVTALEFKVRVHATSYTSVHSLMVDWRYDQHNYRSVLR